MSNIDEPKNVALSDKTTGVKPRYKLGIALSGGGARGLAHAGALQAIEEAGLKPDIVAGVSAGSVAAVLYAAGMKPKEMLSFFEGAKFSDFAQINARGGGLFRITKFTKHILKKIAPYTRIEDLPLKTVIAATDFDNAVGEKFDEGDIGPIMQASCSIPIVFPPVKINGTNYVDGGVLHNLPAWTIREECETLIGVNCSPLITEKVSNGMLEIAMRTFNLLSKANMAEDMALCDIAVELRDIAHYKVFNLKDIRQVYISGYSTTRRALKLASNKL